MTIREHRPQYTSLRNVLLLCIIPSRTITTETKHNYNTSRFASHRSRLASTWVELRPFGPPRPQTNHDRPTRVGEEVSVQSPNGCLLWYFVPQCTSGEWELGEVKANRHHRSVCPPA